MYSIITTEGFIIDSRPRGEAGKLLYIFTKEYGLVMATAQGIRLEKSKLKYFVQDHSFGLFSFVKGKEYWRLTNAQELVLGKKDEKRGSVSVKKYGKNHDELLARVAMLLKKLLHGEESNESLFEVIFRLSDFDIDIVEGIDRIQTEKLYQTVESLIVLRIFHRLGYIGDIADLNTLLTTNDISQEILANVEKNRVFINKHINKAIVESHL